MPTPNNNTQANPIRVASEAADREPGFDIRRYGPGADEVRMTPKPPAGVGIANLTRAMKLGDVPEGIYGLNIVPAGESIDLNPQTIIEQHSRAAAAGARIIIAQPKPSEVREGVQLMYRDSALVRNVDPANFQIVVDGADAAESPLPLHDAAFDWAATPHQAFRAKIARAQRRAVGGEQLDDAFMISVLRGLGLLADKLLVSTILAATPGAFTFGAAAARHAKIEELRALVGTAGTGAEISGDGSFRAKGVLAELTAATDKSVIGLFNRAAVAIRPEVSVHIKRDVNGDSEMTVFVNAQAVVPFASGDFWTVSA